VADYLESIGADAAWVERFDELSEALESLLEGYIRRFRGLRYAMLNHAKAPIGVFPLRRKFLAWVGDSA
jgi:hypothetical protein